MNTDMLMIMLSTFLIVLIASVLGGPTADDPEASSNANLKVLLLNLKGRKDKLKISKFQLDHLKLKFKRIDAVNGRDLQRVMKSGTDLMTPQKYTGIKGLMLTRNMIKSDESGSALGCWLTHLKALQWIINDQKDTKDRPTIIFEDDFLAEGDAISLMNNIFRIVPSDWDLLYVGHCTTRGICDSYVNYDLCKAKKTMIPCNHAYIVRNKKAATELFNAGNLEHPVLADDFFHKASNINAYVVFPHIFKQIKCIKADIGSEGGNWDVLRNSKFEKLIEEKFLHWIKYKDL